ncbi:hypothetical protein ATANTOWER_005788 [Ataeniobius toweri]|uniref:Uncharacterized protein n=1 Tax=Ataeniobius toweri TaxID=208326 RepID=A0ABU7BXZ2_9TELE|nr:hypothetical protein [Ataeniobius toweri]
MPPPLKVKAYGCCGKVLPFLPLLSGEGGYQQRKFLKFLYSDRGGLACSLMLQYILKAHRRSMESPCPLILRIMTSSSSRARL